MRDSPVSSHHSTAKLLVQVFSGNLTSNRVYPDLSGDVKKTDFHSFINRMHKIAQRISPGDGALLESPGK